MIVSFYVKLYLISPQASCAWTLFSKINKERTNATNQRTIRVPYFAKYVYPFVEYNKAYAKYSSLVTIISNVNSCVMLKILNSVLYLHPKKNIQHTSIRIYQSETCSNTNFSKDHHNVKALQIVIVCILVENIANIRCTCMCQGGVRDTTINYYLTKLRLI